MKAYNTSSVEWYIPNIIAASSDAASLRDVVIENRPLLSINSRGIKLKIYPLTPQQEEEVEEIEAKEVEEIEEIEETPAQGEEIISRFLTKSDLRIVADNREEGATLEDYALLNMELDNELISEELAQIYLDQELNSKAIEIYTQLSLLNSEKNSYFASLIDQIKEIKN